MKIGIYNPNLATMGGGEKVCLALAEVLSAGNDVLLITYETLEKSKLEKYFGVNLKNTQIGIIEKSKLLQKIQPIRFIPNHLKKTVENYHVYKSLKKLDLDIFVNNAYNTEIPSPAKVSVFMCMFPHKLLDLHSMSFAKRTYIRLVNFGAKLLMHPKSKTWLDTYQGITANSAFTQKYIKLYWNRDSEIVYPISDDKFVKVEKRNNILNVGRFFHNNGITHHKRQDFLVDTFVKMTDLHKKGWQLHLAGTVNENAEDMRYVVDLIRRSEGYPIHLHLDTPLDKLKELYSVSKIYWHATGYGADKKKNPERQEHFGISTVEAMSAGSIPVVIRSAGQEEVVSEGENGYLWETEKELVKKTLKAISDDGSLSKNAIRDSKKYDKEAFQKSSLEFFEPLYNLVD
ncbi:MAG TPA: glycosyltransferase [Candidatus Microsaccharimonas sp.]|jgi:glycosyltransferase involved in cell wall biosynthesis